VAVGAVEGSLDEGVWLAVEGADFVNGSNSSLMAGSFAKSIGSSPLVVLMLGSAPCSIMNRTASMLPHFTTECSEVVLMVVPELISAPASRRICTVCLKVSRVAND